MFRSLIVAELDVWCGEYSGLNRTGAMMAVHASMK